MSTTTKGIFDNSLFIFYLALLKEKLNAIHEENKGALQKVIVCLELPFVVEEKEIKKFFAKCGGGVKSIELYIFIFFFFLILTKFSFRSGALVFSSAIVEFNKKGGVKEAVNIF